VPQHVEFSISDPHQLPAEPRTLDPAESALDRWGATVDGAGEPCLVIDSDVIVVAMSASFEQMLGLAESPVNRPLLDGDGVLQVLDFGDGNALEQLEVARMPPLLALSSGRLARGLIRIRCAKGPCTFDAIATPLTDDGKVVGSLTFFSAIQ
jgi:PAS domain-containing protein